MTTKNAKQSPLNHIDKLWDEVLLQERYMDEGSWFDAYNPAAVDAVSRRYQFWECEYNNPEADIVALMFRPRAETKPEFQELVNMINVCIKYSVKEKDMAYPTVLWNRLIQFKWEERKMLMEYIPACTRMRNPLLPYPELHKRSRLS